LKCWSGRRESNPRHTAWEAVVLPLNYARARRQTPAPQDNAKGGQGKAGAASALALRRACFTLATISDRVGICRICVLARLTEMPPNPNSHERVAGLGQGGNHVMTQHDSARAEPNSWAVHFPGNLRWTNAMQIVKGMAPYAAVAMDEVERVGRGLKARAAEADLDRVWREEWAAMAERVAAVADTAA